MGKPFHQQVIEYGIPFATGILSLGGIFGAINDAHELITLKSAIIITIIFLLLLCFYVYKLKNNALSWEAADGTELAIRKINKKILIGIGGAISLIWLSLIFNFFKTQPNSGETGSVTTTDNTKKSSDRPLPSDADSKAKIIDSLAQKAHEFIAKGDLNQADNAYTKIFEADNEATKYLTEGADFFYYKGDHVKANALMNRLISLTTESQKKAYLFFIMAENYVVSFQFDSAIAYFQKSSKEYYNLQIISKSYLPMYAYVRSEEIRIRTHIINMPSQDRALDSIADMARNCDNETCLSIQFISLMTKINTGKSANGRVNASVRETNSEIEAALKIGSYLLRFNQNYELMIGSLKFIQTLNNAVHVDTASKKIIDLSLEKSISLCGKYAVMNTTEPQTYFLKDYPNIFRNSVLTGDVIVASNVILLKACGRVAVAINKRYTADSLIFVRRKKEIIFYALLINKTYREAFLKYPYINGSIASVNMMDLSDIVYQLDEYDTALTILNELEKILNEKKEPDLFDTTMRYQVKHRIVLANFSKIDEAHSSDIPAINKILQMAEDVKKYYASQSRSIKGHKSLTDLDKENKSNFKSISAIVNYIKNYKLEIK